MMWLTTLAVYCVILCNIGSRANTCKTKACIDLANRLRQSVDLTLDPCDNFYAYTCNSYLKNTKLQENEDLRNLQAEIDDSFTTIIKNELESKTLKGQLHLFQIAKDLYASCMNTKAIEDRGLSEIKVNLETYGSFPLLERDWVSTHFNWIELTKQIAEDGQVYDMIVSIDSDFNNRKVSESIVTISPPYFDIPLEALVEGMDNAIVKVYYQVLFEVFTLFGADKRTLDIDLPKMVQFEIDLAKISVPVGNSDFQSQIKLRQVSDLTQVAPKLDWLTLLNSILGQYAKIKPTDNVQIFIPSFIEQLGELLQKTESRVLTNYILGKVVFTRLQFLSDNYREIKQRVYTAIDKFSTLQTRQQLCQSTVQTDYPTEIAPIVAANYVFKYVDEKWKENVIPVLRPYKKQLIETLARVDWLDRRSKVRTMRKSVNSDVIVGYPEEFRNTSLLEDYFEKLTITKSDFYQNALNIRKFRRYTTISRLNKPYDVRFWVDQNLQNVVSTLGTSDPISNVIGINLGLLTDFYFNADRPVAINIATLATAGFYFAGSITEESAAFNEIGNFGQLWDTESKELYEKKKQALIDVYSTYVLKEINVPLNASPKALGLIAIEGAYKLGYDGLLEALNTLKYKPRLVGFERFSINQLFWMLNGAAWCTKITPELLKQTAQSDSYLPAEVLVNAPLRNFPAFSEDFGCKNNSFMNPKTKFTFW